jgi:predicted glutamine amidotransferase
MITAKPHRLSMSYVKNTTALLYLQDAAQALKRRRPVMPRRYKPQRTHITIKRATMQDWNSQFKSDLVVPVATLELGHEEIHDRYTATTPQFAGYLIEKEEYYRLKKLLTDPMEELDGELAEN